jgi:hypothetical protein
MHPPSGESLVDKMRTSGMVYREYREWPRRGGVDYVSNSRTERRGYIWRGSRAHQLMII